jgi:acetyl esterase/lipase
VTKRKEGEQVVQVESNVVYGMYSGLALLLDVHRPERPNSYGIVFIPGSGWTRPLGYDAAPLKEAQGQYVDALTAVGYTVFAINHRAAPRFQYPAAIEDAQRAVRYVRFHAEQYGIRADRIGASGGSSGAHLASLLGVLDGVGDLDDPDPVNRESAKVQCVVARATPIDFINAMPTTDHVATFLGMHFDPAQPSSSMESKTYRVASPISHVTMAAAPFLLLHGDADRTVPFRNSELMQEALQQAGVPVRLMRIEGADHGPDFPGAVNPPDYLGEMVRWFDEHLRVRSPAETATVSG